MTTTILIISLSGNVDDFNEHEGDVISICFDDLMFGNKCCKDFFDAPQDNVAISADEVELELMQSQLNCVP